MTTQLSHIPIFIMLEQASTQPQEVHREFPWLRMLDTFHSNKCENLPPWLYLLQCQLPKTNCSKTTPLKIIQVTKIIQNLKPLNPLHLAGPFPPVASAIEPPERRLRRDNRRFTAPPATAVPPPAGRAVRRPSPPRL